VLINIRACKWGTDLLLVSKSEIVPLWIRGIRLGTLSPGIQWCPEVTLPVLWLRGIENIGLWVVILLATCNVSSLYNWSCLITLTSYGRMRG
jgi:hypothetical protein